MTVQSVLDSAALRAGVPEVIAGSSGLNRTVRWVHVSDIRDVTGLLSGEELVLSTGLAIGGSPEDSGTYLEDLITAGASGLVVELSVRLPRLPQTLIDVADRAGFPVIALHTRIRFVSVTEEIHREIVAEQYEGLRRAQRVHEAFTSLSLDGASASEIVKAAATIGGVSLVLEDLSRHVLAHASVVDSDAQLLDDWARRSRLAPALPETGRTGTDGWLTTPVGLQGLVWARLVIPRPGEEPESLTMLIERAAQALEIGRMVERDRLGVEFQAQSGLLNDVLRGAIRSEADAVARARGLGLDAGRSYVPIVVHRGSPATIDPVRAQRQGQGLVESISQAVRRSRSSALVGLVDAGSVGVLLSIPAGRDENKAVERLAEAVHAEVGEANHTEIGELWIGVEEGAKTILACGAGLTRAQQVATVAENARGPHRQFYRHADVRLPGLMALLREDPRVQAFAESELQRLLLHDASHADGTLELLRSFLAAGGNKSVLARDLGRSRPAVYKQLDRLERLLGLPLDDPASRTSLSVALLAHDHRRPQGDHP